jgi:hypothetical protein
MDTCVLLEAKYKKSAHIFEERKTHAGPAYFIKAEKAQRILFITLNPLLCSEFYTIYMSLLNLKTETYHVNDPLFFKINQLVI